MAEVIAKTALILGPNEGKQFIESQPGTKGIRGASGYSPMRICTSAKLIPAALTLIRTCPAVRAGDGLSTSRRTGGPPNLVIRISFIIGEHI